MSVQLVERDSSAEDCRRCQQCCLYDIGGAAAQVHVLVCSSATERRPRIRGNPGSNSICGNFEVWAISFNPRPQFTQLYK